MMRFKRITTLLVMLATVILLPLPAALADSSGPVFKACDQAPGSPVCPKTAPTQDPVIHVINVAANIIAILAGLAAIIILITSGLTMITSGGKEEAVANARKHIVAAIIGLVIVVLAWAITRFVIDNILK